MQSLQDFLMKNIYSIKPLTNKEKFKKTVRTSNMLIKVLWVNKSKLWFSWGYMNHQKFLK